MQPFVAISYSEEYKRQILRLLGITACWNDAGPGLGARVTAGQQGGGHGGVRVSRCGSEEARLAQGAIFWAYKICVFLYVSLCSFHQSNKSYVVILIQSSKFSVLCRCGIPHPAVNESSSVVRGGAKFVRSH